ncbi:radical SAM protein [Nonomuraea longicatena]|uniref:Radical SAM core domain-containing protein n=1 Tax=Nonomuraea longicatena TaxID=83682 RepID=A0ABP4BF36_9ACTN
MFEGRHRDEELRPRVLRGERNWWFLGPGGVAKLYSWHLGSDGAPTEDTIGWLGEQGMLRQPRRKNYSLTVLTTTHCNLGCSYCFQNLGQDEPGGTAPPRIAYTRLNSATIKRIIEFTRERMAAAGLEELCVTLFGGEPLLNPRGCLELLEAAAPLGLRYADMVSNGTLLTTVPLKRMYDLGLRGIQITFDGDEPEHDALRVKRTGGGTFDTIVRNIREVQEETKIAFSLRVNVTAENLGGIDRLVERLAERLKTTRCGIYFKIVGDVGIGYRNDVAASERLQQRFIDWNRRALACGFGVGRPREIVPCPACSFPGGRYGAVVSADGSLSSCWETAGKADWTVGSVFDGYQPEEVTEPRWTTCEEDFLNFADADAWQRFHDSVDAALLDDLVAMGRL